MSYVEQVLADERCAIKARAYEIALDFLIECDAKMDSYEAETGLKILAKMVPWDKNNPFYDEANQSKEPCPDNPEDPSE